MTPRSRIPPTKEARVWSRATASSQAEFPHINLPWRRHHWNSSQTPSTLLGHGPWDQSINKGTGWEGCGVFVRKDEPGGLSTREGSGQLVVDSSQDYWFLNNNYCYPSVFLSFFWNSCCSSMMLLLFEVALATLARSSFGAFVAAIFPALVDKLTLSALSQDKRQVDLG